MQTLLTEKQNQLLVSNSVLQGHQIELERLKTKVKREEEVKSDLEDKKKDISRETSQITQAIKNIFGRCFSTMRIKPVFMGQKDTTTLYDVLLYELDIINMRMVDLIEISSEYNSSLEGLSLLSFSTNADTTTNNNNNTNNNLKEGSTNMSVGHSVFNNRTSGYK